MLRNGSKLLVVFTLLLCCSAAFAQVLIAAAEPAAKGQQAIFKLVNVSAPVCVALFQTTDTGSLVTLSTYYLGTLQTKQVTPPVVIHYRTTSLFALFEPQGAGPAACTSIPTFFLSDTTREPQIYETLTGGDGPPITITQLAAAANAAQQNCSASAPLTNTNLSGGAGGTATGGNGGAGGSGGPGGTTGTVSASISNTTLSGGLTITQNPQANGGAGGNGGNGGAATANGGAGGTLNNTVSGNCNGTRTISQTNSIIQDATAIVVFGFEEVNFRTGDAVALTSALVNCANPSLNTAGAVMTVSCALPTGGGTFSTQGLH